MTNKQLAPKVRAWLKSTDVPPEDTRRSVGIVSGHAERTRQRGRWWPLPSFRRRTEPPSTSAATQPPSSPIPATNGHAPTIIGRTQIMFSPVKAITVGALVFALGGLFLVAQPLDRQTSVPGAEERAEPAPPVKVTITVTRGTGEAIDGGCTSDTPEVCIETWAPSQWSATDARLSGTATIRAAEAWWPHGGDYSLYPVFEAYAIEVVNDEGRWVGTGRGTGPLESLIWFTLTGEGEYEGHSAVVTVDHSDSDNDGISTNQAVIVEGELPPFPEPIE